MLGSHRMLRTPHWLVMALGMAASCWIPAVAEAKIVVGPEMGNALLPVIFPANVAVLEDGSFAIGGTTIIPSTDGYPQDGHGQFVVQTYSPAGNPLGAPFMPELTANPPADNGGIGSLGDHYFVTLQPSQQQPPTSRAAMLSREGEGLAKPFRLPNSYLQFFSFY